MSDGKEVRWYWFRVNDSGAVFMDEDFDGGYVEFTYHDREMEKNSQLQREAYDAIRERDKQIAELRAEVERITSQYQASSIEWGQTIARQAREAEVSKAVIEKLKDKLEEIRWSWANDAGRQCDNLAFEALAAIERAEGEKE